MRYLDLTQVTITSICGSPDPDYWCDSYVDAAIYKGREITDDELEILNDKYDVFVQNHINNAPYGGVDINY